jgi:serine/threonine protein kinase
MHLSILGILAIIIGGILAAVLGVFLILFAIKFFRGFFRAIGWFVSHIFRFITGMISDTFRMIGAIFAAIALSLLVVLNVVIARWSNANHFGRAFKDELSTASRAFYRICIGHPAKLLLLNGLTEGVEVRVANAMAAAPGSDKPSKRTGEFDGYTIVGALKGGGSGGKLFVAEPDDRKRAAFERRGIADIDQVVIKSFSLKDGSSMPQIVRESRALEAAKKLGLVFEHELSDERFYYVMPYVPGESLGVVTQRLHAESGAGGLEPRRMRYALTLVADLLETLNVYHRGGLWHKDIKPDNIIVNGDRATIVDLGLVTPLRSAMTLTTHGTEYFRDPEMVRMALRGAKVHEVDGVKFDIYGAGAVLFSAIENSFPAHGGLSQLSKRCPEALRWIIRRSMAELTQRYSSAEEMLADLRVVIEADDPFALKPKDLPSMGGASPQSLHTEPEPAPEPVGVGIGGSGHEPNWVFANNPAGPEPAREPRTKVRFKLQDWLTGRYSVESSPFAPRAARSPEPARAHRPVAAPTPPRHRSPLTAKEQRAAAQARVRAAQLRARERRAARNQRFSTGPNRHVLIGVVTAFLVLGGIGAAALFLVVPTHSSFATVMSDAIPPDAPQATIILAGNDETRSMKLGLVDGGLLITRDGSAPIWLAEPERATVPMFADLASRGGSGYLVVTDLSASDTERTSQRLDWFLGLLQDAGLSPIVDGDDDRTIEWQARVRALAGVAGIADPQSVDGVRRWLAESPELSGVAWASSARNAAGEVMPDASPEITIITESGQGLLALSGVRGDPRTVSIPGSVVTVEAPVPTRELPVPADAGQQNTDGYEDEYEDEDDSNYDGS